MSYRPDIGHIVRLSTGGRYGIFAEVIGIGLEGYRLKYPSAAAPHVRHKTVPAWVGFMRVDLALAQIAGRQYLAAGTTIAYIIRSRDWGHKELERRNHCLAAWTWKSGTSYPGCYCSHETKFQSWDGLASFHQAWGDAGLFAFMSNAEPQSTRDHAVDYGENKRVFYGGGLKEVDEMPLFKAHIARMRDVQLIDLLSRDAAHAQVREAAVAVLSSR